MSLEGVMNSSSNAVASRHGESKTVPERRFRRRMGLRSPLSSAGPRRRSAAQPRASGGLQRAEVDRENRLRLALYATRLASMGSRLPADEEVALCGRLRSDGPRFAHTLAAFGRQGVRADSGHTRLSHLTLHPPRAVLGAAM